jgi:IS5 family transposase
MFKTLLLGQWHNLSDSELEEALRVRLDFMLFCGFELHDAVPDATTLCRFRNRLVKAKKLASLLHEVNRQLQEHDLMVKAAHGAVVDASFITCAARPDSALEVDETGEVVSESCAIDSEARWSKKGNQCYFGYRAYAVVDEKDGYIRGMYTAPANESEQHHLFSALQEADFMPKRVYADKGYASGANRQALQARQIKSAIMHRAYRNRPLTARQKLANQLIGKVRFVVERCFGTLKRQFGMHRARYYGVEKVNGQLLLKAMCMNLLKAVNKIHLSTVPI